MEFADLRLLVIWLMHAWSASALTLPAVILSWRRIRWCWWELSALAIPFAIWLIFLVLQLRPAKSMSNFVIEIVLITIAVPIAAFIRIAIGRAFPERFTAAGLILGLTAFAVAVYWRIPALPE